MKTKLKYLFILMPVIYVAMFQGCIKEEKCVVGVDDPLRIRLRAGVKVIGSLVDQDSHFRAAIMGWETADNAADYSKTSTWASTIYVRAKSEAESVIITPSQRYNSHRPIKTFIRGWCPEGNVSSDGIVRFDQVPDGTMDILMCNMALGSLDDADEKELIFHHALTQIRFQALRSGDVGEPIAIRSIVIHDVSLPKAIDLVKDNIIYTSIAPLSVPDVDNQRIITEVSSSVGSGVMLKPITGNSIRVDISTSTKTYNDVMIVIDGDSDLRAGKLYTITLHFVQKGLIQTLLCSSRIDEWQDGASGSDDLTDR